MVKWSKKAPKNTIEGMWFPHFAWYPVNIDDRVYWFEWVWACWNHDDFGFSKRWFFTTPYKEQK